MNKLLIEHLKSARLRKNMTQQEVANMLGIKANTLSNWEKGRTEPDIDTFVKLCHIYDINCATILSGVYQTELNISPIEYNILTDYRKLDEDGKKMILLTIENELNRTQQLQKMYKRIELYMNILKSQKQDSPIPQEQKDVQTEEALINAPGQYTP